MDHAAQLRAYADNFLTDGLESRGLIAAANEIDRLKELARLQGERAMINRDLCDTFELRAVAYGRLLADVRTMMNSGAFKEFEGEPWMLRLRNIDLDV